jgi:putative ABC transport system substrate-binding protein
MPRLLLLVLALFATIPDARAQASERPRIVGLITYATPADDPSHAAFREALRELGYVEGRSIRVEFRTAAGREDRLPTIAQELAQLKADVVVLGNSRLVRAVRHAMPITPIVIVSSDPLGTGWSGIYPAPKAISPGSLR